MARNFQFGKIHVLGTILSLLISISLVFAFYFNWLDALMNLPSFLISFAFFIFFLSNALVAKNESVQEKRIVAIGSVLGLLLFSLCFTSLLELNKHWNIGFAFSLVSLILALSFYAQQNQKWPVYFRGFTVVWLLLLSAFILLKLDFFSISIALRIGFAIYALGLLVFTLFKRV